MDLVSKINVNILGSKYTISGETDSLYIYELVKYLEERSLELAVTYPNIGSEKLLVLTSINLIDEIFQLREQLKESQKTPDTINDKNRKLIHLLDKGLTGEQNL